MVKVAELNENFRYFYAFEYQSKISDYAQVRTSLFDTPENEINIQRKQGRVQLISIYTVYIYILK